MSVRKAENVPPAIRILLDEKLSVSPKPTETKRFFRRLLPELRQQAEGTLKSFQYADSDAPAAPNGFVITASGTLNPFGHRGICAHPRCRVAAAEHFVRTVGLYADMITIPDAISPRLAYGGRLTNAELLDFVTDVLVLKALQPLIEASIVRFRNPTAAYCEVHYRQFEEQVDQATLALLPLLQPELKFHWTKDYLEMDMGRLYEPSIINMTALPEATRRELEAGRSVEDVGREIFEKSLRSILKQVLDDLNSASKINSALFSASRLDMLSLNALEGVSHDPARIDIWEAERSVELPWVNRLAPVEIARLREEAAVALPRLREKMLRAFTPGTTVKPQDVIGELRADAAEVEAELKSLNIKRGSRFRTVAGILGVTMAVYGFADPGNAGTALGSLVSLLGLLHVSARKDEQDFTKAKSRPGYVLLKAREMLQHHK
jgi:hypothetical protein